MENERKELHRKILVNLLVSGGILAVLVLCLPFLIRFFMPLIVAWIIASIANPLVRFLEQKIKIMRKHGSAIVIVAVLVLVGLLVYGLAAVVFVEVRSLIADMPEVYEQVMENLHFSLQELHQRFDFIPANAGEFFSAEDSPLNGIVESFFDSVKTYSFAAVGSFAGSLIDIVVLVIMTLMLAYFFVAEREMIKAAVQKHMPKAVKDFWYMAMDTCICAISGYLKACFKIMLVMIVILTIIFCGVMRVRYGFFLAVLTSFLDFLPFLGTGIVLTPWGIYCAITGDYVQVLLLVITYLICLLTHRLLEPKLVGDSVGMSPLATLISMFIGYRLIGMLGLILGIPVGMIVMAFKEQGVFESQVRGIKILAKDIDEYRKY